MNNKPASQPQYKHNTDIMVKEAADLIFYNNNKNKELTIKELTALQASSLRPYMFNIMCLYINNNY